MNFFVIMTINVCAPRNGIIFLMTTIPGGLAHFDFWQKNFITKSAGFMAGWDLSASAIAEWAVLTGAGKKLRWDAAWAIVSTGEFLHSQEQEMLDAKKSYISGMKGNPADTSIRLYITRYIRNNPKVTNEQKIAIGILVADETITTTIPGEAKISGELTPILKYLKHLAHYLGVKDQDMKTVTKEQGVAEIGMFIAITEGNVKVCPPLSAFQYDGKVRNGGYVRTFQPEMEGMRAWYLARKKSKGRNGVFGSPGFPANSLIA